MFCKQLAYWSVRECKQDQLFREGNMKKMEIYM